VASTRALSHAPWSSSKIQTALRCPRLFHYRYVEKLAEPEVMPEARIGKAVHHALEHALGGEAIGPAVSAARELLPEGIERERFDHLSAGIPRFVERIDGFRRRRRIARELVEFSLAMRENLSSTQFYASDALFRGVFDVGFLYEDGNLAVIDHKTGARAPHLHITDQLEGYAVLAAAWFRSVRRVWLGVHWVADAEVDWVRPLPTSDIQHDLVPRVLANIEAAALAVDDGPRANPGVWCERCNYRSVCPSGIEFRFEPVDDDEPEQE
jgi:CRISPR/Cas system-associated exonuclease Cas4 (RecB family)